MDDQDAAPGSFDPLVGTVLAGRYEIIRRIGEGGMGAVYEARHTVIGKRVAVKVLLERLVEKRELVARLLKEARLASAIGHENIVDVTDYGTTEDARSFVVMEYLEGEPLSALLAREAPLPVERCLHIIKQVASALGAAHDKGIVHRDIKPENIYLVRRSDEDFVKVVDFGVSKAVRSADEGPETLRLTRTGILLGTPLYMSPEQARGEEDIDARADVWAVGVVFYECLTGEVPFRANNYLQVISQVLNNEVIVPSKLLPELGIPVAVETVVMKALAKSREERYQRVVDLQRDVERLLTGDPNVTFDRPVSAVAAAEAPRVGPRWHLGIAGVLALGLGLALSLARTGTPPKTPRKPSVPAVSGAVKPPASGRALAPPAGVPAAPEVPLTLFDAGSASVSAVPGRLPDARSASPSARPRRQPPPSKTLPADGNPKSPAESDDLAPGKQIKYIGDDVAPSSEKIFGRKQTPAAPEEGGTP
ncbi:MAG: protein kinase [Myxococcales bacterium]|nr:protein kinase [Myxococcales bacterium]